MSDITGLSPEQQGYLARIANPTEAPKDDNWPSTKAVAEWFTQKPFRRHYLRIRDAMTRQVILMGMKLLVEQGTPIGANKSTDRDQEKHLAELRRCALRLLLSERSAQKRRKKPREEASPDDLTFEEVIARAIHPNADLGKALEFFKSRLLSDGAEAPSPDPPPPPSPPAQED